MEPNTNQPQVNNEPNLSQPIPPLGMPQPSKSNMKGALIAFIIILILSGGYFAYTKFMPNSDTKEEANQVSSIILNNDTTTINSEVTSVEQEEINIAFKEITQIVKDNNLVAYKNYITKTKGSIGDYNLTGNPENDSRQLELTYKTSFEPIISDSGNRIFNKKTVFERGKFEDESDYMDMIVTGVNSLNKEESSNITIIHTFIPMNGKWYWFSYNMTAGNIPPHLKP